jgi:ATP-dependent DNA ligase
LEKKSTTGKPLFWRAVNKGNTNTYTHGQIGGKDPIPKIDVIKKGKNIGKANETTPEQQALFDMETTALKKIDDSWTLVRGKISEHKTHVAVSKDFKKPMKAHKWKEQGHKLPQIVYAQPKLDGMRTEGFVFDVQAGVLKTILGKPIPHLPHITEALKKLAKKLPPGFKFLDGELYSYDVSFEDIISICKQKSEPAENHEVVSLFVFDYVNDKQEPFEKRLEVLNDIAKKYFDNKIIRLVETIQIDKDETEKYHDIYVQQGYEGIMLRDPKGLYEHKRSYKLLKHKHFIDDEYKIVDFESTDVTTEEDGTFQMLGALWFVDKKKDRFKAGLKMSHKRRKEIWDNKKDYLGKMATVRYQNLTDEEQVPRFGVCVAIRDYE